MLFKTNDEKFSLGRGKSKKICRHPGGDVSQSSLKVGDTRVKVTRMEQPTFLCRYCPFSQRRRWSRVFGKTVRTCDATSPRSSLVEGPGESQVPSLCSDAPLSTWHCAAVPCRDTTTDLRHVCTSSSSICRNADSGRPFDPSFNTWRPSISCGCRTRLELSAVLAASSPVTDDVQAPLKTELFDSSFT